MYLEWRQQFEEEAGRAFVRLGADFSQQLLGLFPRWVRLDRARYAWLADLAARRVISELAEGARQTLLETIKRNNAEFFAEVVSRVKEAENGGFQEMTQMTMEKRGVVEGEAEVYSDEAACGGVTRQAMKEAAATQTKQGCANPSCGCGDSGN